MTEYHLFILLHLLLFVYWLGGDVGVFYSSRFVVDGNLGKETRLIAAKIMLNIDLIPRICMALMLTVGGILVELQGIAHSAIQFVAILLLAPIWLGMVLTIHFNEGKPIAHRLTTIDYYFRWFMIVAIIASVGYAWVTERITETPWLALKILIFAFLIFCGLMIRIMIKPFIEEFKTLAVSGSEAVNNEVMAASLARARPFVLAIWVGLIAEAALGVAKPFNTAILNF